MFKPVIPGQDLQNSLIYTERLLSRAAGINSRAKRSPSATAPPGSAAGFAQRPHVTAIRVTPPAVGGCRGSPSLPGDPHLPRCPIRSRRLAGTRCPWQSRQQNSQSGDFCPKKKTTEELAWAKARLGARGSFTANNNPGSPHPSAGGRGHKPIAVS